MAGRGRLGLPKQTNPDLNTCSLYEDVDYKDFWMGMRRSKLDELEHAIVSDLLPSSGYRILDIGCGYGRLASCYLNRYKQIVMIDGSMSLLKQARENTGGCAYYIAGDANHLPFKPGSFDTVLFVRVFHHISDSDHVLHEISRVMSHSGQVILSYRNKRDLGRIIKRFLGKNPGNPFSLDPDTYKSTLLLHHPRYVERLLYDHGFWRLSFSGAGIIDKVAEPLGPLGRRLPPGLFLSKLVGPFKIAPWVFCKGILKTNQPLVEAASLDQLLLCPACRGNLEKLSLSYHCGQCNHSYPITDGIIDLRMDSPRSQDECLE